jgi:hypothetical protein
MSSPFWLSRSSDFASSPRITSAPYWKALLDAEVDELLAEDLRVPGDVVDVLLRVGRRDLAPELLEALDDAHGRVAVAGVVGGGEPDRAPRRES